MKKQLTLLFSLVVWAACSNDKTEDLVPPANNNPNISNCDTAVVKYSDQIASIISANCLVCHRNNFAQGGVSLETHVQVKTYTENGRLLKAIRHESGAVAMPQGGAKLDSCKIRTFEIWEEAGCPDN